MSAPRGRRDGAAPGPAPIGWAIACTLATAAMVSTPLLSGSDFGALADAWAWQPAAWPAQPWRWVTAALVHLDTRHLLLNVLALAAVAWLGVRSRATSGDVVAWLAAWPSTHAALHATSPALASYVGASGVLHAAVGVLAVRLVTTTGGRERWVGAAVLAGLAAKLVAEQGWAAPWVRTDHGPPVVPAAHLTGALCGVSAGLVAWRARRRAGRQPG